MISREELMKQLLAMPSSLNDACRTMEMAADFIGGAQCVPSREQIARAIYETEPHFESGEFVDGFQVSPGGSLSWQQALTRDAEFGDDPLMGKITEFSYRCADAVIAISGGSQ